MRPPLKNFHLLLHHRRPKRMRCDIQMFFVLFILMWLQLARNAMPSAERWVAFFCYFNYTNFSRTVKLQSRSKQPVRYYYHNNCFGTRKGRIGESSVIFELQQDFDNCNGILLEAPGMGKVKEFFPGASDTQINAQSRSWTGGERKMERKMEKLGKRVETRRQRVWFSKLMCGPNSAPLLFM